MTFAFEAAFRASPVPQVVVRLSDSTIVAVNAAFAQLAGRSEGELLGLTHTGLLEPAEREQLRARFLGGRTGARGPGRADAARR